MGYDNDKHRMRVMAVECVTIVQAWQSGIAVINENPSIKCGTFVLEGRSRSRYTQEEDIDLGKGVDPTDVRYWMWVIRPEKEIWYKFSTAVMIDYFTRIISR